MNKYEKIFGTGWARILKSFLESEEFKTIGKYLKQQVTEGKKIYPLFDDMFRAFQQCPYENLVTVFLTSNAYQKEMDGLAFSCKEKSNDEYPEQLTKIFDAVEQDVGRGLYLNRVGNLTRWANRGVLLLNCDLSTEKGAKPGVHLDLWKPFIQFVIKTLSEYTTGVAYVLIGKEAEKYESLINQETNAITKLEHPMLAVKEKRPWRHKNVFSSINYSSEFMNNYRIDWTMPYTQEEVDKFANSGIHLKKIESYEQ